MSSFEGENEWGELNFPRIFLKKGENPTARCFSEVLSCRKQRENFSQKVLFVRDFLYYRAQSLNFESFCVWCEVHMFCGLYVWVVIIFYPGVFNSV